MINKVILIGNLGTEPEIRSLESGVKMARFRLATTERYFSASSNERREHTEWHNIVLWRTQADFAERFLQKGSQVYIEGRIRSREYVDPATGAKRTVYEIQGDDIRALGRRQQSGGREEYPAQNARQEREVESRPIANPDDLPF